MKLKNFLAMTAIALCAVACSDDDETMVNYAQNVTGTYNGYTVANSAYFQNMAAVGQSVTITAASENKVNISYTGGAWGEFAITDADVTLSGETYAISGSGKTVMGHAGSSSEYDCTVKATLRSDKTIDSFLFSVPSVMGGLTIDLREGDAPAALMIAGTYTGTLDLSVGGNASGSVEEETVTIAYVEEDGTAAMTLKGFQAMESEMGDIEITGVNVTTTDYSTYTVSGEVNAQTSFGAGNITVTGSVSGTIIDGAASITFKLKPGAMPMEITAAFTTNAK